MPHAGQNGRQLAGRLVESPGWLIQYGRTLGHTPATPLRKAGGGELLGGCRNMVVLLTQNLA